jgi:hypothetical protein
MIFPRRDPPDWLLDAGLVDEAVYKAIAATPTPSLDRAMQRLSHAAGYSRLWLASAAILAATRGRSGRRAAVRGLASVGASSFVTNLVLKPIASRRRPDSSERRAAAWAFRSAAASPGASAACSSSHRIPRADIRATVEFAEARG